jgi:DHA2 family metal-tetracycline-proton antiporter-like MFS transporter
MDHGSTEAHALPVSLNVSRTLPWIVFLVFFGVLNETVLNVSIPAIARTYGLPAIPNLGIEGMLGEIVTPS